ncbi:NAD(P)H-binding protein [Nocardia sp. NPDC051030]|uniref:NAD(P)H-binding protein n=1 Tax=Nocardia sp. NPDC051030 TaxID=3155162 RepID=UPI00341895FC
MTSERTTILVTGGTGKTGRRIVERLRGLNLDVRVGSRSAALSFDWEDADTWPGAVQGVRAVYLSYFPDLAAPGATDVIRAFTEVAVHAGVEKLVLLSGRGEAEAQACEQIVVDSGVEWTVLRASWFSQNFSENYLLEPVLEGQVVLPVGDVPEPFVDADDIAEVAVAVLTGEGHHEKIYELTGPRLLTFAEAVAEISAAAGRPVEFIQVSADDYAAALTEAGLPDDTVGFLIYLFTTVLDGRNARVETGVEQVLGRSARDFADYARVTADTGIWKEGQL